MSECRAIRLHAYRTRTCCSPLRFVAWRVCRASDAHRAGAGDAALVSTTGRHQFYTVRVVDGEAQPAFKASGDITSMSQADGYIEIPAQTDIVEKSEVVEVKLF